MPDQKTLMISENDGAAFAEEQEESRFIDSEG